MIKKLKLSSILTQYDDLEVEIIRINLEKGPTLTPNPDVYGAGGISLRLCGASAVLYEQRRFFGTGENGGKTLEMVPLIINPIYTLYSGYLLGGIGFYVGAAESQSHPKPRMFCSVELTESNKKHMFGESLSYTLPKTQKMQKSLHMGPLGPKNWEARSHFSLPPIFRIELTRC